MANALYGLGRGHFLDGDIDWTADDIEICFMDSADYTLNIDTDEDQVDLTDAGIVATSGTFLANKSSTLGVADADDKTIATVAGDQFEYIVIYKDSGADATSWLIACIDTATGLPCTPNGGDITVQWDAGASKIFKL
jgi:hypothetical protein